MNRLLRIVLLAGICGLLSSCFAYQAHFNKAVAKAAGQYDDPTGAWKGTWKSNWNGHEGPLWCIITETPGKPGSYDFRYRAGWGVLEFGNYVHTVEVAKAPDGSFGLNGKMELPKLVGTHSVDGSLSKIAFDATYKSDKGDHGIMTLRRPPQKKKPVPKAPAE